MSRGVHGYSSTRRADERVREGSHDAARLHSSDSPRSETCRAHRRIPSLSLSLSLSHEAAVRAATRLHTDSPAHRHTRGWLLTVDSIAGGVLMEAEICDLDELTGSSSGRPASDSSSSPSSPPLSLSLSFSLALSFSDLSGSLGHEALF